MPNLLLLTSIISLIFFNSCSPKFYSSTNSLHKFKVVRMKSSGQTFDNAAVKMIKETDNLIIYAESGYNVNYEYVNYVATKFENNYNSMTSIYGAHTDVDENGKIIILLIKINDDIYRGDSQVIGYFFPNDLFYELSNNAEILYMDINLLNENPRIIAGTVLHEFQHLINFNVNFIKKNKEMSLWLNESLSESTSVLFDDYTSTIRIMEFNDINYYCFYTWELPYPYQNYFVNYPSASVFMNWLYNKNGRNSDIFKRIASSSETEDYNKVLKSVSGSYTWENLLTNWINGISKKEVFNAKINKYTNSTETYLFPGALIYDGTKIQVNADTYLGTNPKSNVVKVSEVSSISERSLKNKNSINLHTIKKPKYIDLVFDKYGKIKKY